VGYTTDTLLRVLRRCMAEHLQKYATVIHGRLTTCLVHESLHAAAVAPCRSDMTLLRLQNLAVTRCIARVLALFNLKALSQLLLSVLNRNH
jgi:hypothetical protein